MTTPINTPNPDPAQPLTAQTRQLVLAVRLGLLRLHKSIMEAERVNYENAHGRIESPHAMLQLLMNDPWFGWFRPLSETVVHIDEKLEAEEPPTEADGQAILREIRSLLAPAAEGEEFNVKYQQILQIDPDIILNHAELNRLLNP